MSVKKLTDELDVLLLTGRTDQALEAQHEALISLNLRALGAKVMAASQPGRTEGALAYRACPGTIVTSSACSN
jgi:hypothetical protein